MIIRPGPLALASGCYGGQGLTRGIMCECLQLYSFISAKALLNLVHLKLCEEIKLHLPV